LHTVAENLLIVPPAKAGKLMNYYVIAGGKPRLDRTHVDFVYKGIFFTLQSRLIPL